MILTYQLLNWVTFLKLAEVSNSLFVVKCLGRVRYICQSARVYYEPGQYFLTLYISPWLFNKYRYLKIFPHLHKVVIKVKTFENF